MKKNIVTEIVEFSVAAELEEKEFMEIVEELEKSFHSKQKGFIDTEILRGKELGSYIMIQHWESMEECKDAVGKMMKESITEKFRNCIIAQSVKMVLSEQIKKWEK